MTSRQRSPHVFSRDAGQSSQASKCDVVATFAILVITHSVKQHVGITVLLCYMFAVDFQPVI